MRSRPRWCGELQITVADRYLISRSTVNNGDAYDLVLRGRHAVDRWNMEGYEEATTLVSAGA